MSRQSIISYDSPLAILWQPRTLLVIVCIGQLIAAIASLLPGIVTDRWIYFGLASLAIQWISMMSIGAIYLFRKYLEKINILRTAWWCLALFVLNAFLFSVIFWNLLDLGANVSEQNGITFGLNIALVAILLGLLGLAAFQNHWNARLQAIKSKQAQLDALHARIQPHFLFNTLNSLAVLIKKDPDQAESLLFNLVDLFRAALSDKKEVNLKTEIAVTKQYLEIEALRFGNRLKVEWELPEIIPEVLLPSLSLQPLVENAIIHGVSQIPEGGKIHISVEAKPDVVGIKICNTLSHSTSNEQTSGFKIGVNNTKERIELMSNGLNKFNTYTKDNQFIAEIILHS